MGAALEKQFGSEVELKRSTGGVFEIGLDGELVFSKKELKRFPDEGEIETIIRSRQP